MKQHFVALLLLTMSSAAMAEDTELDYRSASQLPLYGTLAPDANARYSRLPDSLKGNIRDELWDLGLNSAGLSVRFRTNSTSIGFKWHSRNKFNMNHMTAAGIRGLDLYALTDTGWTFVNSARPSFGDNNTTTRIVSNMTPGIDREYMLYLSLYDGVDSLYIGVDSAAYLDLPAIDLPLRAKPIVMYGTSILQGGCATRPGMAHTNILQRHLNREIINLGFSGNAKLDPEIAHLMAGADASVFVIDAMPNCTPEMVDEKLEAFIGIIRKSHPETPILLVESPWFPIMRWNNEVNATLRDKNARLRAIYARLVLTDPNLYYFEADDILSGDTECTVDNYHLTDHGFEAFASRLQPILEKLMQ